MQWTDAVVREALGLSPPPSPSAALPSVEFSGVSTDTRTLGTGALFVALVGERYDGHDHLEAARHAGALGAVVRQGTPAVPGLVLFPVPDTLRALGALARHRRRSVPGPVVAVTGTNGKTSTKEMLAAVLRSRFRTSATRANLNNLVGVPLTILEAPDDTEALVVEAGASVPGEIARYREIIAPDIAVITTVSHGHVEGFGSLAGVLAEKLDLVDGVALAVVGTDPPALATEATRRARRVITAGLSHADVSPDTVSIPAAAQSGSEGYGRPRIAIDGVEFTLGIPGLHQAANAMCAWAVAREVGISPSAAARALAQIHLPGGRGEIQQHGALTILHDSYNANPQSFGAAIRLTESLRGHRRLVFVAGTMRELGTDAARLHREVAQALRDLAPDLLVGVGEFAEALATLGPGPGEELTAPNAAAAGPQVASRLRGDELVVLKASRGVALEHILPHLIARAGTSPEA